MKLTNFYAILLFLIIIAGTWSCEKDDICADTTETTPHLIILFYDVNAPTELKAVRQLSIRGFDTDGVELANIPLTQRLDSIALPLPFKAEGEPVVAKFILEKDSDFADDNNDLTQSNIDTITVSYIPSFEYVSRACGYKSIFTNLFITIDSDGNNWVLTNEVLTTTIDNETQAHIILRH